MKKAKGATRESAAFEILDGKDIFYWDKKKKVLVAGNEEILPEVALKMVGEAKTIFQSITWKKLVRAMIFDACRKMYLTDLNEGKWVLATIKLFEDKVINLIGIEKYLNKNSDE